MTGWIKLHRRLKEKPIWTASNCLQKALLVTLLLLANHKENEWEWRGKPFRAKPGQFVTSVPKLMEEIGKEATEQKVRTALERFKKYEFITDESTKTGRLITIVNWGQYQSSEEVDNGRLNGRITDEQRTDNGQVTPNKNDNNNKTYYIYLHDFWRCRSGKPFLSASEKSALELIVEKYDTRREWVEEATKKVPNHVKSPIYLKGILEGFEGIGGEEPWNAGNREFARKKEHGGETERVRNHLRAFGAFRSDSSNEDKACAAE